MAILMEPSEELQPASTRNHNWTGAGHWYPQWYPVSARVFPRPLCAEPDMVAGAAMVLPVSKSAHSAITAKAITAKQDHIVLSLGPADSRLALLVEGSSRLRNGCAQSSGFHSRGFW
jgi:hypothetical protein